MCGVHPKFWAIVGAVVGAVVGAIVGAVLGKFGQF